MGSAQNKKMKKHEKTKQKVNELEKNNKSPKISIPLRGRVFTGTVVSDKMMKTVTVKWSRHIKIPKYERYEKRSSKVKAHLPEHINAKKGDIVKIAECRPISKTKKFVVYEKIDSINRRTEDKK